MVIEECPDLPSFLITTSKDEIIVLSAMDEKEVRRVFYLRFPRKRISTVHRIPKDVIDIAKSSG